MLKVQEYLKENSLDKLKEEFGISNKTHSNLPLVILDYSQIDSPKTHPITMECRGLCLELDTWNIVSKGFNRFFNVGEAEEITKYFDWNNFTASTKEDGSYIHLFNYNGEWLVKTRNSFGDGKLEGTNYSWSELFLSTIDFERWKNKAPKRAVGIFELCSVYNKIVRHYKEPISYMLGVYDKSTNMLYNDKWLLEGLHEHTPERFNFSSLVEVKDFIKEKEDTDKTYEGLVLTDRNGLKLKIKSSQYLALHRLKGNNNIFLDKHLLPLVLSGETEEVVCYYPEVKEKLEALEQIVKIAFSELLDFWKLSYDIKDQKEFALKISNCKYNSILFTLRKKHGTIISNEEILKMWRESEQLIAKKLEL